MKFPPYLPLLAVLPLCLSFPADLRATPGGIPLGGNTEVTLADLPRESVGKFPIQQPEFRGQVRQLMVLNDRWLILGIYDFPEVVEKMNESSGGELLKAVEDWDEAEKAGRKDWAAYKKPEQVHKAYLGEAREALGERKLDAADTFKVSSPGDADFKTAVPPARVTRTLVSLGGKRVPGGHDVNYGHYIFLELPKPMKSGQKYTITVADRGAVTFTFDEMSLVSRAIKVNQAGYQSESGRKFAYLGAFGYEFGPIPFNQAREFQVIDVKTGEVVLTGPVRLVEKDPHFTPKEKDAPDTPRPSMYGEDVYEMDLSGLKAEGNFFITIPGVGRSWPFRHGPHAYGEAFYTAARGFYHQRAATALEKPHTPWTRPKSTMHDTIYEAEYVAFPQQSDGPKDLPIFDAVGGTIDLTRPNENIIGGWYDAADWDRNQTHYVAIFDMLRAFEAAPKTFTDGQLNLPESGDGTPDLLNEVAWGLEPWRRSQNEKGGVSGFIETNTHPRYNDPEHPFAFSLRTRWSSLIYAAAAAQYARLVKPFNPKQSELYAQSAKRAWEFGTNPDNSLGRITLKGKTKRGEGEEYTREWEETDAMVAPYQVLAALQLNRLTGDPVYLENIGSLAEQGLGPFQWRFSHKDFSAWIYADLALDPDKRLPAELVEKWRKVYVDSADSLLAEMETMPYRQTWPRSKDYWAAWGASAVTNFNRNLFIAWKLTGDPKYRDAIALNTDYMLGANPLGMPWTTGIGYTYPIDIQHENSELDGIMDPVPGLTIYGINGGPAMHHRGRDLVWESPGADGGKISFMNEANKKVPFFRCWSVHPHINAGQCEFTVHETNASTLFSTAVLMSEGWTPSEELKKRGPRREELLFGLWPMP